MQPATRYFNTSGPNITAQHYTLRREALIQQGLNLVHNDRYFTIWAPRQTGKSTFFAMLGEELTKEGYKVCYINFENYKHTSLATFTQTFREAILKSWDIDVQSAPDMIRVFEEMRIQTDQKLVLIIDEIEGINAEYFGDFLHTIRSLYQSRANHGLKSVIMVGVSNITGVVEDNVSPFNIAESFPVDFFTKEEVYELLAQHETATGQFFSPVAKEKIYAITAGQPGLVNGFAAKLIELSPKKKILDYENYLYVEDWYLYKSIDKNVSNIIQKAKKYRKFLEELLFLERAVRFNINVEHIRYFFVNGLLSAAENGLVMFRVPLYKKCLQQYFYPTMNGESAEIQSNLWVDNYLIGGKILDIDKIIREYQEYAKRRGFRYFIENDENGNPKGLREAALMYSFETYIQSFLQVFKGKSYLEAHVALGRSDLIINLLNSELVIETKIFYNITQFAEGKTQLAYYTKNLNLTKGIYLVFVNKIVTNPYVFENNEVIDGVEITTYLVRYDVDIDFSEPKKVTRRRKKEN
jgi:AAA-like domain